MIQCREGLTMGSDEICCMFLASLHGCSVDLLNHEGQVEYYRRGSGKGEDCSSGGDGASLLGFG